MQTITSPTHTSTPTPDTLRLRALIDANRGEVSKLFDEYGATEPRLFGSVARGEAGPHSDIDILVNLDPKDGNVLWRAAGILGGLEDMLDAKIDVFCPELMKQNVSQSAEMDAMPL